MAKKIKQPNPKTKLVAINAGHLGTNGAIYRDGSIAVDYFPSITAPATERSMNGMEALQVYRDWVIWRDERCYYGEGVLVGTESRWRIQSHAGEARYGAAHYQRLTDIMCAKLGVQNGDNLTLVCYCPPGLYNRVSAGIEAAFSGDNAKRAIHLHGEEQPRQWTVQNLIVFPEGYHIGSAMALDDHGRSAVADILDGKWAVLDGGGNTLDMYSFVDGQMDQELFANATRENAGLIKQVLAAALAKVNEQGGDYKTATLHDIDLVFRSGLRKGDWWLRVGNSEINLENLFAQLFKRCRTAIKEGVCDDLFVGFNGYRGFALLGGLYYVAGDFLDAAYPNKMLRYEAHSHLASIEPVNADVVGTIRYLLNQLLIGKVAL